MPRRPCSVDDCSLLATGRGMCQRHYLRWYRYGDPLAGSDQKTPRGAAKSFLRAVLEGHAQPDDNGCIRWPFGKTKHGYGVCHFGGRHAHVAQFVLEHFVGPRPSQRHTAGHAPHDVCGNRDCVAPAHLSWQTWDEQAEHQRVDGTYSRPIISDDVVRIAVQQVAQGRLVADVARDLDVGATTVARWVKGLARRGATEAAS